MSGGIVGGGEEQLPSPPLNQQPAVKRSTTLNFGRRRRRPGEESGGSKAPKVTNHNNDHHQLLQLIVSKCRCEFYMIDFDDKLPDSSGDEALLQRGPAYSPTVHLQTNVRLAFIPSIIDSSLLT